MSLMNVLNDFPYTKHFYLTHPWKFLQECWWNIKASWSRCIKGYAGRDVAEMDEFLLYLIPAMLHEMADGDAYPGNEEFPTYESWQNWCNSLADRFEAVQEKNWDGHNEWEEKWHSMSPLFIPHPNLTTTYTFTAEEAEEVRAKYYAREKELFEERE